jgi:hypothetical protein
LWTFPFYLYLHVGNNIPGYVYVPHVISHI